jgi:hypothetical protein
MAYQGARTKKRSKMTYIQSHILALQILLFTLFMTGCLFAPAFVMACRIKTLHWKIIAWVLWTVGITVVFWGFR